MFDESLHHKRRDAQREFQSVMAAAGLHMEHTTYLNGFLLPAIAPARWLRDKLVRPKRITSDFNLRLPGWVNTFLSLVFRSEWVWLRFAPLPLGLSLCALGRKPAS